MERGLMMVLHAALIGLVLYLLMVYGLGQRAHVAENRSILLASFILAYMVMFGHGLPFKLNRTLLG